MTPHDQALAAGAALEEIRTSIGMSRRTLGELVAEHLERANGYDASTSRKWEREGNLSTEQMIAVEQVLSLPPGELLRRAGYLGRGGPDLESVIQAAEDLTPEHRALLVDTYRALRTAGHEQTQRPGEP